MQTCGDAPGGLAAFSSLYQASDFERHAFDLFCEPVAAEGRKRFAFRTESRHRNLYGGLHGGVLMAIADTMMGSMGFDELNNQGNRVKDFTRR
jgi:acyl-coenzyme A thioesterase PaaI-like protein